MSVPSVHKQYQEIRDVLANLEFDVEKFERGNATAGTRVRRGLQDIRKLAQDLRKKIQDMKRVPAGSKQASAKK